jgi:uncharacterized protein YndB with AHSA1/START domain
MADKKMENGVEIGNPDLSSGVEIDHPGPSGREINSSCILSAPRALVLKTWSDPEHLKHWWGPKGFKNTFQEFDFKPGGNWRFIMHGPDGVDYPNHIRFIEIGQDRIVLEHVGQPHFTLTATFEDLGERTRLSWHSLFETVAAYNGVKSFAVDGNRQNLERLQAYLVNLR